MRNYPVTAPFDGMVLSRNTNVGDFAGDITLVEIADLSEVWVELHAIGKAAAKLEAGQPVRVLAETGVQDAEPGIDHLLPQIGMADVRARGTHYVMMHGVRQHFNKKKT